MNIIMSGSLFDVQIMNQCRQVLVFSLLLQRFVQNEAIQYDNNYVLKSTVLVIFIKF